MHSTLTTLIRDENKWTFFPWIKITKQKNEITKAQHKNMNHVNRIIYSEESIIRICSVVYEIYEGEDSHKFFNFLSRLKNKKLIFKREWVVKHRNIGKEFEHNQYFRTAKDIYRYGHGCIRIMKCMTYFGRFYENLTYLDVSPSILRFIRSKRII